MLGPVSLADDIHIPVHRGSEAFSFWTHGVSMLVAIAGLVWTVVAADSAGEAAAFAVYFATMVLLFFSSTLHHAVQSAAARQRSGYLRRLDHIAIYLFIAGSYVPVTLLAMPTGWGVSIMSVVGGLALVGAGLKLFAPFTPKWVTIALYIALGWIAVIGIKPLIDAFTLGELTWLFAGGVVYTLGAFGYAKHWPDLWPQWLGAHGVWHVMVMIAAALHATFHIRFVLLA